MKRRSIALALLAGACTPVLHAQTAPTPSGDAAASKRRPRERAAAPEFLYRDLPAAMAFADDLAARRGLDAAWVRDQIGRASRSAEAIRGVTPPPVGVPKNWAAYRARFIEPVRLAAGQRFWQANRATLERAEAQFGVPAALIVGVIGVETLYGRHMGTHKVMDALTTLTFDFPAVHPRAAARSAFFRDELEQFLSFTQRTGTDPHSLLGSFAGAMGWPQFMPSSWVKYAIDFDGDGKVDLFDSQADVIGSVANYFKAFGWQTGLPTHHPVRFDPTRLDLETLLAPDILPTFSLENFLAKGAIVEGDALRHTGKFALVELQNAGAPSSYVAGTENFYVVTRYNWSSYYALAVIELGEAVKAAVDATR